MSKWIEVERERSTVGHVWIIMDGYSRYSKYSKIHSNTDTAKYELKNLGCGYLGIQCTNNSCNFSVIEILHDKVLGKESRVEIKAVRGFDLKKITDRKEKEGIYIHAGEWDVWTVPLLSISNFRQPAQTSSSLEGLFLPQSAHSLNSHLF